MSLLKLCKITHWETEDKLHGASQSIINHILFYPALLVLSAVSHLHVHTIYYIRI